MCHGNLRILDIDGHSIYVSRNAFSVLNKDLFRKVVFNIQFVWYKFLTKFPGSFKYWMNVYYSILSLILLLLFDKKNFLSFLEFLESTSFSISVVIRYLLLLKNGGPGRSNTKNSWIKNNKLEENNMVSELSRLYFFEVIFINVLLETLLSFPSVKYYY